MCDELFRQNLIKGCLSFGVNNVYDRFKHPECLLEHWPNANKNEIRRIFTKSSIFIMPSRTEGLNRTPIEATLCGCPSVICDGAIDDVFFDNETCLIAQKDNFEDILKKSKYLIQNNQCQTVFRQKMENILETKYTLQNVVSNLKKLL